MDNVITNDDRVPDPKVLVFLDCDGVLNSHADFVRCKGEIDPLNPGSVELFKQIQEDMNCTVVLSSTWRMTLESIQKLRDHGIHVDQCTPVSRNGRGKEITAFLKEYCENFDVHPRQLKIAIIDDDISDIITEEYLKPDVFKTSMMEGGLTNYIASQVRRHLKGEWTW